MIGLLPLQKITRHNSNLILFESPGMRCERVTKFFDSTRVVDTAENGPKSTFLRQKVVHEAYASFTLNGSLRSQ